MTRPEATRAEATRPEASAEPTITVIAPVWNGEREVGLLLDALAAQTAPERAFEVIVVDNGSTDGTADVLARYPSIRVLREPEPGSYRARNLAIRNARGRFLLFTDADCVPAPDWVATALRLAERHGEDCVIGGRIELFRVGRTGRFSVRYEELTAFQQEWNLARGKCVTANWLCSKRLLESVGGFKDALLSGGDVECAQRIAAAGHAFVYAPQMTVGHPTRATLLALARKRVRVTGGRWLKAGSPGVASFSRMVLDEHLAQARWMKGAAGDRLMRIGLLSIIASLWLVTQLEILRLRTGARPTRS